MQAFRKGVKASFLDVVMIELDLPMSQSCETTIGEYTASITTWREMNLVVPYSYRWCEKPFLDRLRFTSFI